MDKNEDLIIENEKEHKIKFFEENTKELDRSSIKLDKLLGGLSRKAYKLEINAN